MTVLVLGSLVGFGASYALALGWLAVVAVKGEVL